MKLKGTLSNASPYGKALIFIGVSLLSVSICTILAYFLSKYFFKINLMEEGLINHIKNQNVINSYKLAQGLSAFGLFVLGPIISAYLFSNKPGDYLRINKFPSSSSLLTIVLLMLIATPAINYLLLLNQQLNLPDWMSGIERWMKESEDQAALFTEVFLSTASIKGLLFNLLVIALIPAMGEELLFRGIIQQAMIKMSGKKHMAIFLTAAFFSAFHMQFYGFLPRMALGLLLGYAFYWSGSLWLSIAGHFFNNGLAVFMAFYAKRNGLPFNQDTIGTEKGDLWILLFSIIILVSGLIYLYKNRSEEPPSAVLSE